MKYLQGNDRARVFMFVIEKVGGNGYVIKIRIMGIES